MSEMHMDLVQGPLFGSTSSWKEVCHSFPEKDKKGMEQHEE